jgi:hypothetical protein
MRFLGFMRVVDAVDVAKSRGRVVSVWSHLREEKCLQSGRHSKQAKYPSPGFRVAGRRLLALPGPSELKSPAFISTWTMFRPLTRHTTRAETKRESHRAGEATARSPGRGCL